MQFQRLSLTTAQLIGASVAGVVARRRAPAGSGGRVRRYALAMSDDREPDPAPILASDAERDRSVLRLRDAVGDGRLTLEEFSDRVGLAQSARTDQELARLTSDLPTARDDAQGPAAAPEQHRAICSHLTRSGPWSLPARSAWRSVFGTIDLDLRQVRLASSDTALEIYNLFGTVTVIVPEGVEVVVRGGGLLASQKVESPERPPLPGAPRLTIECRGPGGTLYVRTQPAASLLQSVKKALNG